MEGKIGITGSSGVLGKLLIRKLIKEGIGFSCFEGDICSKEDLLNWVKKENFEVIIHLAAIVATSEVEKDKKKALEVNVAGTRNLIETLLELGKNPWLFYASSSHVYKSKDKPLVEDDEIEPLNEYGKTKYEAEKIIARFYENSCVGRIFSFYHTTQKKPFLYPSILERLQKEDLTKPFELFGAESIRDFLNAEEVVEIIFKLIERRPKGTFNIASGKGIKIKDFVQNMTNYPLTIVGKGNKDYLVADISKLNKALQQ